MEHEDDTEYGKRHKKFNEVIARGKRYIEITNRVQNSAFPDARTANATAKAKEPRLEIGPFMLCHDAEINCEVLDSEKVY